MRALSLQSERNVLIKKRNSEEPSGIDTYYEKTYDENGRTIIALQDQ